MRRLRHLRLGQPGTRVRHSWEGTWARLLWYRSCISSPRMRRPPCIRVLWCTQDHHFFVGLIMYFEEFSEPVNDSTPIYGTRCTFSQCSKHSIPTFHIFQLRSMFPILVLHENPSTKLLWFCQTKHQGIRIELGSLFCIVVCLLNHTRCLSNVVLHCLKVKQMPHIGAVDWVVLVRIIYVSLYRRFYREVNTQQNV